MIGENNILERTIRLQRIYADMYCSYVSRGVNAALDPDDLENNFDADWKRGHYFETGTDAIRVIVNALIQNLRHPPKTILDLPSGSGRVTRHMLSFFPDAKVVASDLYEGHMHFCRDVLGAEGVISKENFDDLAFETTFDLIFSGSLLTHLPADLFVSALRMMGRSLSKEGIAIVTLSGRHTEFLQRRKYRIIEDDLFDVALATVPRDGFGYVDYNHHLLTTAWHKQANYGVTISMPHWTLKQLESELGLRIMGYAERGWDFTQDVLIFGKPGVNAWMRDGDAQEDAPLLNADPR